MVVTRVVVDRDQKQELRGEIAAGNGKSSVMILTVTVGRAGLDQSVIEWGRSLADHLGWKWLADVGK